MTVENMFRYAYYSKVPTYDWVKPRPCYGWSDRSDFPYRHLIPEEQSGKHRNITWTEYFDPKNGYPLVPWGILP